LFCLHSGFVQCQFWCSCIFHYHERDFTFPFWFDAWPRVCDSHSSSTQLRIRHSLPTIRAHLCGANCSQLVDDRRISALLRNTRYPVPKTEPVV